MSFSFQILPHLLRPSSSFCSILSPAFPSEHRISLSGSASSTAEHFISLISQIAFHLPHLTHSISSPKQNLNFPISHTASHFPLSHLPHRIVSPSAPVQYPITVIFHTASYLPHLPHSILHPSAPSYPTQHLISLISHTASSLRQRTTATSGFLDHPDPMPLHHYG